MLKYETVSVRTEIVNFVRLSVIFFTSLLQNSHEKIKANWGTRVTNDTSTRVKVGGGGKGSWTRLNTTAG